ncbi:MAG TPA: tripartite tricarboxylate transporter substrate binding protein, partial [Burkholderiaceae bacterium]
MQRRHLLGRATALAAAGSWAHSALAQKFPSKPITLVVPFAPGGNLDVVARTLAPALERTLGQSVIVDNRAGAGGSIGAAFVARADPDGHIVLITTPNAITVLPQMVKMPYRLDSFQPVGLAATTSLVVVAKGDDSRFPDIAALLSRARANPNNVSVGHAGPGTTNHIAILQLEEAARITLNPVPYKGSAPALTDLLGGQIDFVVDQLTSSAPHIRSGALRALAVMSRDRDPALPKVPTLREAGLTDFDATTATGLLTPTGTPPENVRLLNAVLRKALDDDIVKSRLLAVGSVARASSVEEWRSLLQQEADRTTKLAQA